MKLILRLFNYNIYDIIFSLLNCNTMYMYTHYKMVSLTCLVTGIFVLLKNCPRIKIFRKFLSYGIKYFVLGHKFSENFCPRTKNFRKFLSYPDKICPTSHRTKIFRKVSETFWTYNWNWSCTVVAIRMRFVLHILIHWNCVYS